MNLPDPRVPLERELDDAVEGWRHWLLTRDRPELYSTQRADLSGVWVPRRTAIARCPHGCERMVIPNLSCSCGIYSARELIEPPKITREAEVDCFLIPGRVLGWGKVIEGSVGWRTSKAYPLELWVPYDAAHLAKPLERAYGCKVALGSPAVTA